MESLSHDATTLPQRAVCQAEGLDNEEVGCAYQDRSQLGKGAEETSTESELIPETMLLGGLLLGLPEHCASPTQVITRPTKE